MATDAEKANVEPILEQPQSFVKKIQAAKEENKESNIGLCFAVCGICLGTLGCQIISILFTILPIAMIYFGAKNLHNCTIEPFIPIFLLVQGICTLLDQFLIYCQCRNKEAESETNKKTLIGRLFDTFVFIWFIVGSVYIYKIYKPNYIESVGEYCDKTTYLFAFWSITVVYALVGLLLIGCLCACLVLGCVVAATS